MKKLKLKLDDLEVTSFAAQDEQTGTGTVNGLQLFSGGPTCVEYGCPPSYNRTECAAQCTLGGCYPSQYCSYIGPGMPNNTCYEGCVTDNYAAC
jgi:hypothetical protein